MIIWVGNCKECKQQFELGKKKPKKGAVLNCPDCKKPFINIGHKNIDDKILVMARKLISLKHSWKKQVNELTARIIKLKEQTIDNSAYGNYIRKNYSDAHNEAVEKLFGKKNKGNKKLIKKSDLKKTKLQILGVMVLNENTPELFAELLEKGVGAFDDKKPDLNKDMKAVQWMKDRIYNHCQECSQLGDFSQLIICDEHKFWMERFNLKKEDLKKNLEKKQKMSKKPDLKKEYSFNINQDEFENWILGLSEEQRKYYIELAFKDCLQQRRIIEEVEKDVRGEIIQVFKDVLSEHEEEVIITCNENCFCWEIRTTINKLEKNLEKKQKMNEKLDLNKERKELASQIWSMFAFDSSKDENSIFLKIADVILKRDESVMGATLQDVKVILEKVLDRSDKEIALFTKFFVRNVLNKSLKDLKKNLEKSSNE